MIERARAARLRPVLIRSSSFRRAALPWLAAALLWLQALGLWHGVLHPQGAAGAAPVHALAGDDHAFAGHDEGDAQCRLYDQLAHADIAFGTAVVPQGPSAGGPAATVLPAGRLAPQAAGFLARGPPPQG